MSLAELIEFFCNQRKTGRLKIDYPRGHSVFFIKDGELVDAKVGALQGAEAVYFSLTLPNAAFDFSPEVLPQRRTITQSWTQVVLEGLRRLDEGESPTEADAFGTFAPSESDMAQMLDQVERLGEPRPKREKPQAAPAPSEEKEEAPLSLMVEGAGGRGSKKKWAVLGVAAALVAACAVAAVPLMNRKGGGAAARQSAPAPAVAQPESKPSEAAPAAEAPAAEPSATEAPANPSADYARREREERERRERRERREEEAAARREAGADAAQPKPTPAAPSGPKSVRVSVTYDEAGRVTQASVAGATPGAEAYGATALRVARGRRFPAGQGGSTVITIPVN